MRLDTEIRNLPSLSALLGCTQRCDSKEYAASANGSSTVSTHPTATSTDENLKKGFQPVLSFERSLLKVRMEEEGDSVMENLGTDDIIDIVKGRVGEDLEDEEDEEVETGATFGLFGDPTTKEEEEEDLNAKYNHIDQSKTGPDLQEEAKNPNTYQDSYPPPQAANPYHQVLTYEWLKN